MPAPDSGQGMPGTSGSSIPSPSSGIPGANSPGGGDGYEEPWEDISDGGSGTGDNGSIDIGDSSSDQQIEPTFNDTEPDFTESSSQGSSAGSAYSTGSAREQQQSGDQNSGGEGAGGEEAGGEPSSSNGAMAGSGPVLTGNEQVAILDEKLNTGTAEFDNMILKERESIRHSASDYFPDDEATNEIPEAYPGAVYDEGNSDVSNAESSGQKSGYGQTASTYPRPSDIPDGNDDDVVARQLREAAMREPDPSLREKLWDEYRKYKGIGQ